MPSPADELVVEAELVSSETSRRPIAPVYKALASIVATFPSYKDTRSGRKNAKQLKVIFVVIGLITLLAGREVWPVIVCGVILMSLATFLPIENLQKRTLVNRLRRAQTTSHEVRRPAKLVHDGRRLILYDGEQRERRVLTNRPFFLGHFVGEDATHWVQVSPKGSNKKKEAIWLRLDGGSAPDDAGKLKEWRVDTPAYTSHTAAHELLELLAREHLARS